MGVMGENMYQVPDFEKNLHQCSNLTDVCKFLHEELENINLLKEYCEPTITLMKDIFDHLKLKENYIIPCDVIEDEKVDEFFSDLNLEVLMRQQKNCQNTHC